MDNIINKVAESGLVTINLEDFYPEGERVIFDMKDHLFEELLLKEKDFREFVKTNNWTKYKDKFVAITCSNDAIVASWAYMIVAAALQPYAKKIIFGNLETLETVLFHDSLSKINREDYSDQRIIIKGCSDKPVPVSAYVELTSLLQPIVKSIMYGEPCSTVPVYKSKKQ
ncbi:MAG: DUF2480 family protein [Bacteroidota bacterium]